MANRPCGTSRHAGTAVRLVLGALAAAHAATPVTPAAASLPGRMFWDNAWPSDTNGVVAGTVLFAQSQVLPSGYALRGDTQPRLVAYRKTLVLFRPREGQLNLDEEVTMTVKDSSGTAVVAVAMAHPNDVPKHAGWTPGVDPAMPFPSELEYAYTWGADVETLNDAAAAALTSVLNDMTTNVSIALSDAQWTRNVVLPDGAAVPDGAMVKVATMAEFATVVRYPNTMLPGRARRVEITQGNYMVFVLVGGAWVASVDAVHNGYVFGRGFLSGVVELDHVAPGMSLEFSQDGVAGTLKGIDVGGMTELLVHTVDVGLLTAPRGEFTFQSDVDARREYFETIPVSRLIVTEYAPVAWGEIMMPDGRLLTIASAEEGSVLTGDLRKITANVLIAQGINMANYGMASSSGTQATGPGNHPYTCAQITAHNVAGMYANGRVVHGLSGGDGAATLDASVGSELSRVFGMNYGLVEDNGGFLGSVHRGADKAGSTWGWDSTHNVFAPNFWATSSGKETCCCGASPQCEAAFEGGHKYGTDAMAGGMPLWENVNRHTLHTPTSARAIQRFFEGKAMFNRESATGFSVYEAATRSNVAFDNPNGGAPVQLGVPVTTLVGYYDPEGALQDYAFPALHGSFGHVYEGRPADSAGCELRVETAAGPRFFALTSRRVTANAMNKYHVNVATADAPSSVAVVCNSEERVKRAVDPPAQPLAFSVDGPPLPDTPAPPTPLPPTPQPPTAEPPTTEPATAAPDTAAPATIAPTTAEPLTRVPGITAAPAPPTNAPPTLTPGSTAAPAPPTLAPGAKAAPVTPAPPTPSQPPTPVPGATANPATPAPPTPAPDTPAPPTRAPDQTMAPPTEAPPTMTPPTPSPGATAMPPAPVAPTEAPPTLAPGAPPPLPTDGPGTLAPWATVAPGTLVPATSVPMMTRTPDGKTPTPSTDIPQPQTAAPGETPMPLTTGPATLVPGATDVPPTTLAPGETRAPTAEPSTLVPDDTAAPLTGRPATPAPANTTTLAPDETRAPTVMPSTLVPDDTAAPPTDQPATPAPGPTAAPQTDAPSGNGTITTVPGTPLPATSAPRTASPSTAEPATIPPLITDAPRGVDRSAGDGDGTDSPVWVYIVIAVLALACCVMALLWRRSRRNEGDFVGVEALARAMAKADDLEMAPSATRGGAQSTMSAAPSMVSTVSASGWTSVAEGSPEMHATDGLRASPLVMSANLGASIGLAGPPTAGPGESLSPSVASHCGLGASQRCSPWVPSRSSIFERGGAPPALHPPDAAQHLEALGITHSPSRKTKAQRSQFSEVLHM